MMAQLDLFPQLAQAVSATPSVDAVRARLDAMLDRLRAADSELPFTTRELAYWEVVTPQMSNWLPEAERADVCAEFSAHLARLCRAAA
jgi:hypothetical protein